MTEEPAVNLAKVRVKLEGNGPFPFEAFWAEPLGDDLYRLDNFPFYAFNLHFRDVVRALEDGTSAFPTIVAVAQPSGHKTLRVLFDAGLSEREIQGLLDELVAAGAEYERAQGRFYAVNVPPSAGYQDICDRLWRLEQDGRLQYEIGTTA